jgi:hypothetical protein
MFYISSPCPARSAALGFQVRHVAQMPGHCHCQGLKQLLPDSEAGIQVKLNPPGSGLTPLQTPA